MLLRQDIHRKLYAPRTVRLETAGGLVPYPDAIARMEQEVDLIRHGQASELLWLVEHPPLYTAGTSSQARDLVDANRFPVFEAGRGGQYTYHGPGQRVAYVMLDLRQRGHDVRAFVAALERWIITTLAHFGIHGETRENRVGVWVPHPATGEAKIAAIGIRVRHGISFHGIAINLDPALDHFSGIVPCGVTEHGVTSFGDLGLATTMADLDRALCAAFAEEFGPLQS